jgi:hypothetical protein
MWVPFVLDPEYGGAQSRTLLKEPGCYLLDVSLRDIKIFQKRLRESGLKDLRSTNQSISFHSILF